MVENVESRRVFTIHCSLRRFFFPQPRDNVIKKLREAFLGIGFQEHSLCDAPIFFCKDLPDLLH